MSRPPEQLVCSYLDGSASAQEVRLLDEALQSDIEVARLLVDMAALDTHLMQAIQQDRGAAKISPDLTEKPKPAPATRPAKRRRSAKPAWRVWAAAAAMAASVFLTTAGWLHLTRPARVHGLHGVAYRIDAAGKTTALSVDDSIRAGDIIATGDFPVARLNIECPDGTQIQLENSTRAAIEGKSGSARVRLFHGEISVDATPSLLGREVAIVTSDCQAQGRRACLYVKKDRGEDGSVVSVETGQVECIRPGRATSIVRANQHALVGGKFKFVRRVGRFHLHQSPPFVNPPRQFRIPGVIQYASGMAFTGTHLWVANGGRDYYMGPRQSIEKRVLFLVDPRSGVVVDELNLGNDCGVNGASGVAWDPDQKCLWVADFWKQTILKVDPTLNALGQNPVVQIIPAQGKSIVQVAYSQGTLWGLGRAGLRDVVVYEYDTQAGVWVNAKAPIEIPSTLDGYYALAARYGVPYLHFVGSDRPGSVYQLNLPNWLASPVFRGSEPGARVKAMCHDPIADEWWILSRTWSWIRPLKVARRAAPAGLGNERQLAAAVKRHFGPASATSFAANRHERTASLVQAVIPETRPSLGVANDRESLTLIGPQLESKIAPHKKVLQSNNLQRGRFSPSGSRPNAYRSGPPNAIKN